MRVISLSSKIIALKYCFQRLDKGFDNKELIDFGVTKGQHLVFWCSDQRSCILALMKTLSDMMGKKEQYWK